MTGAAPAPVVFLTGTGRSGSTLLANAVGSLPGVVSAGEVRYALERGVAGGGFCGCTRPVGECPVWTEALADTFGAVPDREQALELDRRLRALVRTRRLPALALRRRLGRDRPDPEADEVSRLLGVLLTRVAAAAGASAVVDSSRLTAYGALLQRSGLVDLKVVHLVRDPRAVAWSWQREVASQSVREFHEPMEQFDVWKTSAMWLTSSTAVPALWPKEGRDRLTVRYEDFVADPAATLRAVAAYAGIEADTSFVRPDGLHLQRSHAAAGNPNRVRHGAVVLRHDDEWRTAMSARERRIVSAVTAPRRTAYGY